MLAVSLGFSCNNACVFCAQGEMRARDAEGEVERRARIERALAGAAGACVAFVGGEPTLDPALARWITLARARGARRVLVQTNGRRLAYAAYARELAKAAGGALSLEVSVHGSTEAMHDYHTQVPGSFRQTVLGLKNARVAGLETAVGVVITRSNYRHLLEIVRLAGALGARGVRFAVVEPFGNAARSVPRLVPPHELVQPHLERALAEARILGLSMAHAEGFAGLGEVERPVPARTSGASGALTKALTIS